MYPIKRIVAVSSLVWCLMGGVSFALTVYMPHITPRSESWATYLQVDNSDNSSATFTLTLYDRGVQVFDQTYSIDGLSERSLRIDFQSSYLCGLITYYETKLNFRCTYLSSSAGMAEFTLTGNLYDTLGCYFSDISPVIDWKGIALTNFHSTTATVTLYAVGDGRTLQSTNVSINPNSKVVGTYEEWFPRISFSDIKKIIVESDRSLCGVVISGDSTNEHLLFTAATELSSF
jgi:hypothetical protein